jgi:uncharacterized OB-fold protein
MPPPVVNAINEGMWRAAAGGRLAVQRCARCGVHRYPPADGCYRCGSLDWDWTDLPGTGVIYTYIWIPDRARSAEQEEPALYNVAVITLDGTEGDPVRILSNVVDAWHQGDLEVGQAVELSPVEFEPGLALPCFRVAAR